MIDEFCQRDTARSPKSHLLLILSTSRLNRRSLRYQQTSERSGCSQYSGVMDEVYMLKVKTEPLTQYVLFRSLPALLLLFGLAAPAVQAAPAADDASATITVFAPGAAQGAPVWVEYQDASGNWQKVDGWL